MNSPKKRQQMSRRPKLTRRQKHYLFAVILRDKQSFRLAKSKLDPARFSSGANAPMSVVWQTAVEYHERYNKLANYDQLLLGVEAKIMEDDSFDDDDVEAISLLLRKAWAIERKNFNRQQAADYLRFFMEELVQDQMAEELMSDPLSDLQSLLSSRAMELSDLRSMSGGPLDEPFPAGYEKKITLHVEPTGLPFVDVFLNGGTVAREVYGFVGPIGSCKTTLSVMLAVLRAQHLQELWEANGSPPGQLPIVYLVAWEEPLASLRMRALGFSAEVSRRSMESGKYSTSKELKPYEKQMFRAQLSAGVPVLGEQERVNAAAMRLNRNLRFVDFTGGTPELKSLAGDFVEGVTAIIDQDQHLRDDPGVGGVYLDYAKAAALKHCIAHSLDETRKLRHLLSSMPLSVKTHIAEKYGTAVWIMHQLSTEAGSRAPGVEPKPTDTMEAKNFFENVDFGLMVGTVSRENLCQFVGAKTRRAERRKPEIVHVDGDMFRVNATGERFVVHGGSIVAANQFQQFDKLTDGKASKNKSRKNSLSDVGV